MPEISRFLGIIVRMFYADHAPPHFHAEYGEYVVKIDIASGVVDGRFPPRALRHLREWYHLHHSELMEDWRLCSSGQPPRPIAPLE
jgi:hypothetical protein